MTRMHSAKRQVRTTTRLSVLSGPNSSQGIQRSTGREFDLEAIQRQTSAEALQHQQNYLNLQRQEEEEEEPVQTAVQREASEEVEPVQTYADSDGAAHGIGIGQRIRSKHGQGSSLPLQLHRQLETHLGSALPQITIHTDTEADALSRAVSAKAFTTGSDIFFRQGTYSPESTEGQKLIAHETTHVLQQSKGPVSGILMGGGVKISEPSDSFELEAAKTAQIFPSPYTSRQIRGEGVKATQADVVGSVDIQRFETNEHQNMGDAGSSAAGITLGTEHDSLNVTFGDMTAMAGDYFGSVAEINRLASQPGNNGQSPGTLDEIRYVVQVKIRRTRHDDDFSEAVQTAVMRRYYMLASNNVTHFSNPRSSDSGRSFEGMAADRDGMSLANPLSGVSETRAAPVNNQGSYRSNHIEAIREAVLAGSQPGPVRGSLNSALIYEGFASHFLTDAYSAGHLRTPRADIKSWWDTKVPMFWLNFKWWMAERMAANLGTWQYAVIPTTTQVRWESAREILDEIMQSKGIPDLTFGDVISGAMHDYDNQNGVMAMVGDELVRLVGDGEVLDERGRELVAGVDTLQRAVAGVRASLRDIHEAFDLAQGGQSDPNAVIDSLLMDGHMFRAEQLWPRALSDSDPQQTSPSLNWQTENSEQLLSDARVGDALRIFARGKADTLRETAGLEGEKARALEAGVLRPFEDRPVDVIRQIINYTPNSTDAGLGGIGGHDTDDNAMEYYQQARSTPGGLESLTYVQRERIIQNLLEGATVGADEDAIVRVLQTANSADARTLIRQFGWERLYDDIDDGFGEEFAEAFPEDQYR